MVDSNSKLNMKSTIKYLLFTAIVFVFTSNAFSQVPNYVPTNGLVGYWPFNGNANDESGNGNNGTVNGATLTTDRFGNANSAYGFDGLSNFIQTINSGPTGTGISVSYWYKSIQTNENIGVVVFGGNSWASYFEVTHNHWSSQQGPCNGPAITGGGTLFNPGSNYNPNNGNWHHVLVVLPNGSTSFNQTQFYLDGVLLNGSCSFANYGAPIPNIGSANPIKFGCSWQPAHPNYYNGTLDDISIYNRALTPAEITQLYTGTSVTPPVACTPFLGEDQTVCAGTSVTLSASGSSLACPTLPSNLQNGLVGYWPFCGNANDASGNGNNGTVNGATLTTDRFGNANSAFSLSGTSNSILVNDSPSLDFPQGVFSLCAEVKLSGLGVEQGLIDHLDVGGPSVLSRYTLRVLPNNKIRFNLKDDENDWSSVDSDISLDVNVWYSIVGVFNYATQELHIYINGEIHDGTIIYNALTGPAITPPNSLFLGNFAGAYNLNGTIDNVSIYNRALSPSEIQQLFTLGHSTYLWSNGETTPTINVSPTTTTTYTCTVTDANGNVCTDSVTVFVPQIEATDLTICAGESTVLSAGSSSSYIGLNGPADGLIFYDKGNNLNGWRFIESSPIVAGNAPWGCAGTFTNNTSASIGSGLQNTINISNACGSNTAATFCNNYSLNNFADWFLPSKSELELMFLNLNSVSSWNYNAANGQYWSSTESSNIGAYIITVQGGLLLYTGDDNKNWSDYIIPCRYVSESDLAGFSTYLWSNGATTPTINVSPTTTTTYTCTITRNGVTCLDSVTVVVNNPTINLGSDVTACGTSTTLTAPTGYDSYVWSNGAATNTTTVTANGTYTCTVTQDGCSVSDALDVTLVNATISATDSIICVGETTTLSIPQDGSSSTACAALPTNLQTGLVGYWPFCGNANDASGNGNNGTVNGATLTTDRFGNANSAYSFDGNDNIFSPRANLSSFSVSAWINPSTSDCFIPVVDAYPNSWEIINVCGDGDLSFIVFQPQGQTLYSTNVTLNPNTWYHIGVIYDAPNVKIYVNGLLVLNQNTIPIPNVDGLMNFGASISGNSQYLNGKLDDIAIHNRALTASEIQQLYTLGQTTYSWSTGATTPSITVSPTTTTTTYTCTTTINGVSCTDSVTVVVNNPTIDLGNDVTACGTSTTLTAPTGFDSYLWSNGAITNTTTVTANGTYTCTVKQGLCSATDTIDVVLVPLTTNTTPISACDSYLWNGTTYTTSGVYTGTTTNCVTESLNLTITPSSTNTTTITACDSYVWNGTTYTTSGTYTGTTTNCVTESLNLTITPSSTNTTPISACDSYLWNGTTYTTSGVYSGTTTNCVTESLNLTITPSSTNTTTITACDSYVWNGTTYSATGVYTGTTTNCVTESLSLTITASSTNTTTASACNSYTWNGTSYTTSGVYTGTTTNCVTESLNLTITPSSTNTTTITACDSYVWNGTTYTTSGVYTGTTTNCVTESLNLTITPLTTTGSVTTSICAGDSYVWPANGQAYTTTQSGLTVITGCNTATLNLTITPSSTNTTTITACNSYVWNGTTYTTSGVYSGTTTNCVTESLNLTITPSSTNTTIITACGTYTWANNGQTYTTSGVYTGTTTDCVTESLVLTITTGGTSNITTITACGTYTWANNGQTYTTSGVYTGTTTNCVTEFLNLTITPSSTNTLSITACGSYVWNGTTYASSGVYTGTTTNCITQSLNLTIIPPDTNTVNVNATPTYFWVFTGQIYTVSGTYQFLDVNKCVLEILNLSLTNDIAEESSNAFTIFPNPVSDMLYVNLNGQDKQNYLIIDNFGSVVKKGVLGNLINEISVSELSAGLYYFKIEGTKPRKFSKID
jgi:hypothetical protein